MRMTGVPVRDSAPVPMTALLPALTPAPMPALTSVLAPVPRSAASLTAKGGRDERYVSWFLGGKAGWTTSIQNVEFVEGIRFP